MVNSKLSAIIHNLIISLSFAQKITLTLELITKDLTLKNYKMSHILHKHIFFTGSNKPPSNVCALKPDMLLFR